MPETKRYSVEIRSSKINRRGRQRDPRLPRKYLTIAFLLTTIACIAVLAYLFVDVKNNFVQLSEQPERKYSPVQLQPVPSTLGLNLHIPYSTLGEALDQSTANPQTGSGEQQTCKKILGAKACATLHWQYRIERENSTRVVQQDGYVRLSVPLKLNATVGVNGKSAKLLGFRKKQLSARAIMSADLRLSMQNNWCPEIHNELSYQWVEAPKLKIFGNVKLNLKKSVDKALKKKLGRFEEQLKTVIDCEKFQHKIKQQWRVHNIPLSLPDNSPAYLSITPHSAHISDSRALTDALNVSLELNATTEVQPVVGTEVPLQLPPVSEQSMPAGAVEFSILLKIPYEQLNQLLAKQLINKKADTDQNFTPTSVEVYPHGERLIFSIGFNATGLAGFFESQGRLFVSAQPAADPVTNVLRFDDIKLTRVIDNKAFNVLSAVLHERILDQIKNASTIDLSRQIGKLEQSVIDALSDPEKTGGIRIQSSEPEIGLVTINPEEQSLALIVHLSTRLTGTIPASAIIK